MSVAPVLPEPEIRERSMTMDADKKPRFMRVVRDGKLWLRDRKPKPHFVGPFASWAEAAAHMKRADRENVPIANERDGT